MLAWSSPSLEYLHSDESEIPITVQEGAWITSASAIGSIIGYIAVPILMDRVGRKYTLFIFAIPQIISWILIAFAKSFIVLCIARTICGIGYGCIGLISIYIGEITEIRIRGMMSIMMVISGDIGIFLVATMGAYLTYQTMNLILISVPVIFFVTLVFMPESPYFYSMKGRDEDSLKALMRLRGVKNPGEVKAEMEQIKITATADQELKGNKLQDLFSRENRRGLLIVVYLHTISICSGSLAMVAYAQQIFQYSGFSLTPAHSYMVLGAVKIISGTAATQLIEILGRKVLHFTSGLLCTLSLLIVGVFFLIKLHFHMEVSFMNWLPLVGLIIFEIAASFGIAPLPFVLGGEVLSIRTKNISIAFIFVISAVSAFLIELAFPILNEATDVYISFFIFSLCCLSGTVLIYYFMPETKGKSLSEIKLLLNSRGDNKLPQQQKSEL